MKDIILDCDPGQDDALAILLALGNQEVNLKAITVVGGNADVDKCYRNAIKVLAFAGRLDIPVYKGSQKPLKQNLKTLKNVFGECGMAGTTDWKVPEFSVPKESAVDFLIRTYSDSKNCPHLVATAPLTNLAMALKKRPKIAENIPDLTIMGGCVYPEPVHGWLGNITFDNGKSYAEYNFATDPEAADIVLNSGIKNINLIGLDITRTVLYNGKVDLRFRKIGTEKAVAVADMLATVGEDDKIDYINLRKYPTEPVRAIHDAVAMCYLLDSSIFTTESVLLKIDLKKYRGQSVLSQNGRAINVIRSLNKEKFFNMLCQSIINLG